MKSFITLILCLTIFSPQPSFAKIYLTKEQKLRQFILKLESEQDQIQGGAIAILDHGRVVYKKTFGYEKTKTNPITAKTLFPLASVSKAVSATAIALMVEDGELKLDEKYKLPYLHNSISIRNILGHTTGYNFSGNSEIEDGYNRTKLLKTLELQQPKCNPDSCYRYSNLTFSLIEDVLNTKNLSLHYAIKKLCTALNTNGIQIEPIAAGMPIAYPHAMRKTKRNVSFRALPIPPYYPKVVPAAAGVYASLDGMIEVFKLNFGYRSDLISNKTLNIFHAPIIKNYDLTKWNNVWPFSKKMLKSYYGLGWRIVENSKLPNKELIFHSGHISGVRSFIGFIPSENMGLVFLTNQDSSFSVKKGVEFWWMFT